MFHGCAGVQNPSVLCCPYLCAGAFFARDAAVNIDGETSFVDNSATSTVQESSGGGQIRSHWLRRSVDSVGNRLWSRQELF